MQDLHLWMAEGANFALFYGQRCKNDMPELLEILEDEQNPVFTRICLT